MADILKACASAIVAAVVTLLTLFLQRKWNKEDKKEDDAAAMNTEILDKLTSLEARIISVDSKLESHLEKEEQKRLDDLEHVMKQVRARILRFESDLLNDYTPYPTEAMFLQNADDEQTYKAYLKSPDSGDFQNGICEGAMNYIDKIYRLCKENHLYGKPKEHKET